MKTEVVLTTIFARTQAVGWWQVMNKRTGISVHGMIDLSHVTCIETHDMAVWHYK